MTERYAARLENLETHITQIVFSPRKARFANLKSAQTRLETLAKTIKAANVIGLIYDTSSGDQDTWVEVKRIRLT